MSKRPIEVDLESNINEYPQALDFFKNHHQQLEFETPVLLRRVIARFIMVRSKRMLNYPLPASPLGLEIEYISSILAGKLQDEAHNKNLEVSQDSNSSAKWSMISAGISAAVAVALALAKVT